MPGDCKNFSKYQDNLDVNGDAISSWAENVENKPNHYRCRVCGSSANTFKRGMTSFNQHAKTDDHKDNMKKTAKYKKQLSIAESMKRSAAEGHTESELKKSVLNFEIDLNRRLDRHNVPKDFMPCIVNCIKTHLSGDDGPKIVEKLSIGATKARYMAKHGIAKTYQSETVMKLKSCDGFSVGFDESEINKITELEVLVLIADETGIELRHYHSIELDGGDAKTITNSLVAQFEEDKIPWKEKLVSMMTDGCATMQGRVGGVKKLLADRAPQVIDLGSCNDHHLGNAARHGCGKIKVSEDYDTLPEMFIDLYYDLGAAPGKGNKRKLKFEEIAKAKGRKLKAFHKYGNTRFKGYKICIEPILFNWENIIEFYTTVEEPSARQEKLRTFFVDQEFESLLKLHFVMAATVDIMEAIAYFEGRENKIHLARAKMENILRIQLLKFMKKEKVHNIDFEGNVITKAGHELLLVKTDKKEDYLSRNLVFIGQKCEELIQMFGLTPSAPQLDEFFTMVFSFHEEVASKLVKYFSTGLRSTELEYMEAFSPLNQTAADTPDQILFLAGQFSKILKNLRPNDGFDKLKSEVHQYQADSEVGRISKSLSYNKYWLEVSKITEGIWKVFEVLPRLALVLGTPFNSGAEMERGFSVQSDIHRNPKRNQMSHDTLDSHMQIRYGIESRETKDKCEKCGGDGDAKTKCACHCKLAEISDDMRMNCSKAYTFMRRKDDTADENLEMETVEDNDNSSFKMRIEKFKVKVSKRVTLYGAKKVVKDKTSDPKTLALENRKRNNTNENNNGDAKQKKKTRRVPIRNTKDNETDNIDDINDC